MAPKLFPSLVATAFAAVLFHFFLKRRSKEIDGGEANENADANNGTAGGTSSTHTSKEGQGMDASSGYDYEVFLSFRGPDTRSGFTDFLYTKLKDVGIRVYKDDEELREGEEFGPKLLIAINQSRISIPIFSKGYASSVWCLKELVQMVKCQKIMGQKIMPIFYDVEPSEVRHQTGGYKQAFLSHENKKRYDKESILEWRAALKEVSLLIGWDLHNLPNRQEGEFARKLTQKVFNELKKAYLVVSDYLVNVDNHVDAIMKMIGDGTSETRVIGIHGMGGIGKTTIAKTIYNKLLHNFENCCFLRDIRTMSSIGNGIQRLQNQLICDILKTKCIDIKDTDEGTQTIIDRLSNKRVLLLLDDVEEGNHIDAFVGRRGWLGRGSKVIITTRNKNILQVPEVDCSYELSGMDTNQSLQLFSKHAFRKDYPLAECIDQSMRAISIAGGLPLTLEVIGSLLSCIEKEKWGPTLKKLENVPHATVHSKLKISYDALDVRQQNILLDIACLFIGYHKDILVHFWNESKYPEEAMEVLQNMSLIKITENNTVWMHDQLRDFGREIVRQKSGTKIEKQSRVWDPREGSDLLRRHKGNKEIEALRLNLDHQRQYRFTCEGFESLSELMFLEVGGSKENFCAEDRLLWHESSSNAQTTIESSHLLPQLRWLSWRDIPPAFNITSFSMEDVIFLDLTDSGITDDWKGWSHTKVMKNLKVLALSYCQNLQRLPEGLGRDLASLEYLSLSWCKSLERLPDSIGNLESLIYLDTSGTRIKELPDSIGKLKNLKVVKMEDSGISKIPDAFWMIEKLEEIEASKEHGNERFHVKIGDCIYRNKSLRILRLRSVDIYALPMLPESLIELELDKLNMDTLPDLSNLVNLKKLDLEFGGLGDDVKSDGLVEDPIPQWIGNLTNLESLALSSPYVTTLPIDVGLPPQLKLLRLRCSNLRCLPRLPSSLSSLNLNECDSLCSVDLSNLKKLSSLEISAAAVAKIQGLGCLENLRELRLYRLEQMGILPDLGRLDKVSLKLRSCEGGQAEVQGELSEFLDIFNSSYCPSLQKLSDLSSLMGQRKVNIVACWDLNVETIAASVCNYLRLKALNSLRSYLT